YHAHSADLECKKHCTIKLSETTSLADLVYRLENTLDFAMADADAVCIGGAGHYDGQHLLLEGAYPYAMPFAQLALEQAWPIYDIIHDYAPIVCATFTSYMQQPHNIKPLNHCSISPHG